MFSKHLICALHPGVLNRQSLLATLHITKDEIPAPKDTHQPNAAQDIKKDKNAAQDTIPKKEVRNAAQDKPEDKTNNQKTDKDTIQEEEDEFIKTNSLLMEDAAFSLSHDELLEVTKSLLHTLTSCDSLLSDLPEDVMLEEVLSQIAVEHGQSITLFISREDEPQLKVIVPQSCSVRDLKKAINRHFEMYQKRKRNKLKISWKYIWRTYDLSYEGTILDKDSSGIHEYNVTNKVTLQFKKKLKNNKFKNSAAT